MYWPYKGGLVYILTEFELGWVIGIIEGEGSFVINRKPTTYQASIVVKMSDQDTIKKLQEVTKVGTLDGSYKDRRNLSWKPMFCWRVQKKSDTLDIAYKILPYLSERRQMQLDKLIGTIELLDDIAYMKTNNRKGRGYSATQNIRQRRDG